MMKWSHYQVSVMERQLLLSQLWHQLSCQLQLARSQVTAPLPILQRYLMLSYHRRLQHQLHLGHHLQDFARRIRLLGAVVARERKLQGLVTAGQGQPYAAPAEADASSGGTAPGAALAGQCAPTREPTRARGYSLRRQYTGSSRPESAPGAGGCRRAA